ncbi:hypothetical protein QR680_009739 [Steinernema hermaphroditum]|uniref:Transmembrane protein 200A n=1 Tax=Steinernema hermaphroditum TaxID=289476 RepID=A0AA39MAB2_9BILA|nr:hypothetical protein QR680_009739 [Steinernema hermaphroditum]
MTRQRRRAREKRRLVRSFFLRSYYERNRKTLWAACRAVAFGTTIIVFGMIMAVVGYFDKDLSTYEEYDAVLQKNVTKVNDLFRIQLKSMQYIGPVVMGIGSFLLIIACVITLESRDRHAQVIQDENLEYRRMSERLVTTSNTKTSILNCDETPAQSEAKPFVPFEEERELKGASNGSTFEKNNNVDNRDPHLLNSNGHRLEECTTHSAPNSSQAGSTRESTVAEIHVPRRAKSSPRALPNGRINRLSRNPPGSAPMADMDSLLDANLSSSSSSLFLINDPFAV